jgi:hypothetical protein
LQEDGEYFKPTLDRRRGLAAGLVLMLLVSSLIAVLLLIYQALSRLAHQVCPRVLHCSMDFSYDLSPVMSDHALTM